jgi:hypothetical protein
VLTRPRQQRDCAQEARDMHIVATGMHHRDDGVALTGGPRARVGQAGLFTDREGVHVGAQENRGSRTLGEDSHHAGAADPLVHLAAVIAQPGGDVGRRPMFPVRQLGVRVQVAVEVLLPGPDQVQTGKDGSGSVGRHRSSPVPVATTGTSVKSSTTGIRQSCGACRRVFA